MQSGAKVFSGTTMVSPGFKRTWLKRSPQRPFVPERPRTDPLARMMNEWPRSASLSCPPRHHQVLTGGAVLHELKRILVVDGTNHIDGRRPGRNTEAVAIFQTQDGQSIDACAPRFQSQNDSARRANLLEAADQVLFRRTRSRCTRQRSCG